MNSDETTRTNSSTDRPARVNVVRDDYFSPAHIDGSAKQTSARFLLYLLVLFCRMAPSAGNLETLIGIAGKDFVLLAADTSISGGGISFTSRNVDKIQTIFQDVLICSVGDSADARQLVGELGAKAKLHSYESGLGDVTIVDCATNTVTREFQGTKMTVDCIAEQARYRIAESLRRGPLNVNVLVAGMSGFARPGNTAQAIQRQVGGHSPMATDGSQNTKAKTPALFWLDEYGSLRRVEYGVHGYASQLLYSILDRSYREDLDMPAALDLLQECLAQLKDRYLISQVDFCVKCIDQNGCRVLSSASSSTSSVSGKLQQD